MKTQKRSLDAQTACRICGETAFRLFESVHGVRYCEKCADDAELYCRVCKVPLKKSNQEGYHVCRHCSWNGVCTPQDLVNLSGPVFHFFFPIFDFDFRQVPLRIDPSLLVEKSDTVGYAKHGKGILPKVYIMKYAPKKKVKYYLVHELIHCWQSHLDLITGENKLLTEGFAEWMEILYARQNGDEDFIANELKREDPIYGKGLQLFYKMEKSKGANFILKNISTIHRSEVFNDKNLQLN